MRRWRCNWACNVAESLRWPSRSLAAVPCGWEDRIDEKMDSSYRVRYVGVSAELSVNPYCIRSIVSPLPP
jgi:hypothetical protein